MFNFWTVMYLVFIGLIAGYAARFLLKGEDTMTWWQTMLLGIVGSFIGGFGAYVLFGWDDDEGFFQPSGLIASVLGAIVALAHLARDPEALRADRAPLSAASATRVAAQDGGDQGVIGRSKRVPSTTMSTRSLKNAMRPVISAASRKGCR